MVNGSMDAMGGVGGSGLRLGMHPFPKICFGTPIF